METYARTELLECRQSFLRLSEAGEELFAEWHKTGGGCRRWSIRGDRTATETFRLRGTRAAALAALPGPGISGADGWLELLEHLFPTLPDDQVVGFSLPGDIAHRNGRLYSICARSVEAIEYLLARNVSEPRSSVITISKKELRQALGIGETELRNRIQSGEIALFGRHRESAKQVSVDISQFTADIQVRIRANQTGKTPTGSRTLARKATQSDNY